jgi:septal ring factor EnvC (AmiA/AmiB activator)
MTLISPDKSSRSWAKRFVIAVLRPFYVLLLRPIMRPLAWRWRNFLLGPALRQMEMLQGTLASKLDGIESRLHATESKLDGVAPGLQRLEQQVGEALQNAQRLEAGIKDIRNEISAIGRSTQDVLTSLSIANEPD